MQSSFSHQAQVQFRHAARLSTGRLGRNLPPVLAFSDSTRGLNALEMAAILPAGWGLVYRHFGAPERKMIAARLARIAQKRHFLLLIGNDPQLAKVVGADGVHWPERQMKQSRKWRRTFRLMTCASHSPASLRAAANYPVHAIVQSVIFKSDSPSAQTKPIGPIRFRSWAASCPKPMYALGGVTSENAKRVAQHGGLASASSILKTFGALRT